MYPKLHHVSRVSPVDSIYGVYVDIVKFLSSDTSPLLWFVPYITNFSYFNNSLLAYCTWEMVYYQIWCNKIVTMHFPCWVKNWLIWNTTFGKFHNCPLRNKIIILLSVQYSFFKGELHSNYICPGIGLYNPIYKNETFFALPKLTFQHHLNKVYMGFYLLTWAYFNDINGGKNLNLKESFLWVRTWKNETKLRKTEKTWKKKITAMKVTSVKMRYQI